MGLSGVIEQWVTMEGLHLACKMTPSWLCGKSPPLILLSLNPLVLSGCRTMAVREELHTPGL